MSEVGKFETCVQKRVKDIKGSFEEVHEILGWGMPLGCSVSSPGWQPPALSGEGQEALSAFPLLPGPHALASASTLAPAGPPQVGFLDLTAPPHPAGGPLDPGTQEPSKPPPGLVEAGGLLPCAQSSLMTRVLSVSFLRVYVPVSDFPGSSIPSSRPPSRPRSCFIELHIRTRYGKAHSPG